MHYTNTNLKKALKKRLCDEPLFKNGTLLLVTIAHTRLGPD